MNMFQAAIGIRRISSTLRNFFGFDNIKIKLFSLVYNFAGFFHLGQHFFHDLLNNLPNFVTSRGSRSCIGRRTIKSCRSSNTIRSRCPWLKCFLFFWFSNPFWFLLLLILLFFFGVDNSLPFLRFTPRVLFLLLDDDSLATSHSTSIFDRKRWRTVKTFKSGSFSYGCLFWIFFNSGIIGLVLNPFSLLFLFTHIPITLASTF